MGDGVSTVLDIGVLDGRVGFDGRLGDGVVVLQVVGQPVEHIASLDDVGPEPGVVVVVIGPGTEDPGERVGGGVPDEADAVTQVGRTEERQYEVEAFAHAVVAERLAEILVTGLEVGVGLGHVHQAADTKRAVEHEAAEFPRGLGKIELQQGIDEPDGEREIGVGVGQSRADHLRHDHRVAPGQGTHEHAVEHVVEGEPHPVPGIEWIGHRGGAHGVVARGTVGRGASRLGGGGGLRRGGNVVEIFRRLVALAAERGQQAQGQYNGNKFTQGDGGHGGSGRGLAAMGPLGFFCRNLGDQGVG